MRKMCLLSFLLLLLTLPFLVHGSASAQTETLRVMVYDRENMPEEYGSCEDNAWVRYIQSRVLRELDIDLQFVRVKRADDVAQINLLAGQNEPPDIMFTYEYDFWLTLCRNGLVADITDELEENGCYALTAEQLLEILRSFQQADFAGRGTDAPAFLSYGTTYWPMLLLIEGFYEQDAISDEDLASRPFFLYDGAKEGYRYLNTLYNAGLLNSDFAMIGENDKSQYGQAIINGDVGFWCNDSWYGFDSVNGALTKLYSTDPSAEVAAVDILAPDGRPAYKYTYHPYGMMVFVSSRSAHTDAAVRYLNWLAQPENDFVLRYGFENEHYTLEGNMPVAVSSSQMQQPRISVTDLALMYNGYAYAPDDDIDARLSLGMYMERLRSLRRDAWRVAMTNTFSIPTLTGYIPASLETVNILAAKERELRIRTIMCPAENFDEEWDRCVAAYLSAGGSRAIEAKRSAYRESIAEKKGN